ncbi:MAG: hypothetical protein AAB398_03935, partial [Pseudomonadota bacterium]
RRQRGDLAAALHVEIAVHLVTGPIDVWRSGRPGAGGNVPVLAISYSAGENKGAAAIRAP